MVFIADASLPLMYVDERIRKRGHARLTSRLASVATALETGVAGASQQKAQWRPSLAPITPDARH